jgi:translation initiation factor 3 subunit C
MREHVIAATHAMRKGDWQKCKDYVLEIKVWELFINKDKVKEMLGRKIQEESLRTFIFTFSETYDTLSLERLSQMFELPVKEVHSIVSRMIIKEELLASLDEPTRTIVLHHAKPNKLQCQTVLLAEKISTLADHNEELMKLKHAGPWSVQNQNAPFSRHPHSNWQNKFRRGQHSHR